MTANEVQLPPKPANLPHPDYHTPRGVSPLESVRAAGLEYPNYTPFKLPNLTTHPFTHRGHHADPSKSRLLSAATEIIHLTPDIGTEVAGLQLAALTPAQKDDLALLVAERGVVFFRDQDMDVHEQIAFTAYFGELHIHQMAGIIPDLPWVHPIYKDQTAVNGRSHQIWHSDVSYELQPPGLTMLRMDTLPAAGPGGSLAGGDTIWASGYALYECMFVRNVSFMEDADSLALSPKLRAFLETLKAKHSGLEQAEKALKTNGCLRRDPIETIMS